MTDKISAFRALDIAGAGMTAEMRRLEVIASNLANASTTRTPGGGPYRRQEAVFRAVYDRAGRAEGVPTVKVDGIEKDPSEFPRVFKGLGYPDADAEGYVAMPNVDSTLEMVDMMESMRAYEANLRTGRAFKSMADAALQIGR